MPSLYKACILLSLSISLTLTLTHLPPSLAVVRLLGVLQGSPSQRRRHGGCDPHVVGATLDCQRLERGQSGARLPVLELGLEACNGALQYAQAGKEGGGVR